MSINIIFDRSAAGNMSSYTAVEIREMIAVGNVTALNAIKGIGTKTAQRIIVDLKDKVVKSVDGAETSGQLFAKPSPVADEAVAALVMAVGENFITDSITSNVKLKNGKTEAVTWYQFKIPIRDYTDKVGNIKNFKSIRFIRMFLTGFEQDMVLNVSSTQLIESTADEYKIGFGYVLKDFDVILRLKNDKQSKIKNDLKLTANLSYKDVKGLLRKIDENITQATNGNKMFTLKITADYVFSSKLNIQLYYDHQSTTPLVSSSYPVSSTNFGTTFKFMLTR